MRGIYLVFGYPTVELFSEAVRVAEDAGFDFLEVGIPFSDPVADGPILTKASKLAIERGATFDEAVKWMNGYTGGLSLYVMTYANILWAKGLSLASKMLEGAGVKGAIVADLPNTEHGLFLDGGFELPIVPFATPETREKDLKAIEDASGDFVYFVSVRGTTGGAFGLDEETERKIEMVRKRCGKPVVIGFGISTSEHVKRALSVADGFVIGTRAVSELTKGLNNFESWCRSLTLKVADD